MKTSKAGIATGLLLATIGGSASAGAVDAKLLDVLRANGSITAAQHAELSADLAREQRTAEKAASGQVKESDFLALQQKLAWASTTAFKGDMRVRQDTIDIEGEPTNGGRDKNRQRIRARLGAFAQVNPEVEVGIQVASGNAVDRRTTNQDMTDYFDKKNLWYDLAYIDYHPAVAPGLKLLAGKMKQPWVAVGDVAWDGDINPEGIAASYTKKIGSNSIFGSGGYYVLKDNIDGEGVEFSHDLNLYALQIGSSFDVGDDVKLMLGASYNGFNNDQYSATLRSNGNTTDAFELYELFGQMDVIGLPLPLSMYAQYVINHDARDFDVFMDGGEDTAWLFGFRTNVAAISVDYNYRDVEANAVVGAFTDSDFASGYTNSSGHKLKLKYDIAKNFAIGATYFLTESDAASRYQTDADVNTLTVDLEARF